VIKLMLLGMLQISR